jgi:hypothetical protein
MKMFKVIFIRPEANRSNYEQVNKFILWTELVTRKLQGDHKLEGSGQRIRRERDRRERERERPTDRQTDRQKENWGFWGGGFGEGMWVCGWRGIGMAMR